MGQPAALLEEGRAGAAAPWRFVLPVVAAFLALSLLKASLHVPWRDEWRPWQIARSCASAGEVWSVSRFEGHPALWFLSLYSLERVSSDVLAMKVFHVLLAAASVLVLLRCSPFTPLQKLLLVAGYYLFFEYNTISRNYAIGVLGLMLSLAAGCRRGPSHVLLGGGLALMSQSNIFAVILAGAVGAGIAVDWIARRKELAPISPARIAAGAMLAVAGMGASLYQVMRVPELSQWHSHGGHDLPRAISGIALAFCPIPRFQYAYWNTSLLDYGGGSGYGLAVVLLALAVALWRRWGAKALPAVAVAGIAGYVLDLVPGLAAGLGIVLFLALAGFFRRQWGPLVLWILGAGGVAGFIYWKFPESTSRHWGHVFLCFLAALWLAEARRPTEPQAQRPGVPGPPARWRPTIVLAILLVQAVGGVWASALDCVRPFSQGKAAAEYIQAQGLAGLPIVAHRPQAATTVSGYLNVPLHFPEGNELTLYNTWEMPRRRAVTQQDVVGEAERLAEEKNSDALILMTGAPLGKDALAGPARPSGGGPSGFTVEPLASFEPTVAPDETYFLYRVRRARSSPP